MDGHSLPAVSLPAVAVTALAAVVAPLAVALGRGIADALAQRRPVTLTPPRQWGECLGRHRPTAVLAAGVGAALALRWSGAPLAAGPMLTAVGVAVLAAMVDVRCHRLPNVLVGPLALGLAAVVGVSAVLGAVPQRFGAALLAGAIAGLLLGVGWLVGMGLGDVKFGATLGFLVGWPVGSWSGAVLAALAVVGGASAAASVWWAACRLRRRGAPRWFPFGPFLAGAAILVLLATGPPTPAGAAGGLSVSSRVGTGSPCVPGPPVDSGVCSAS